MRINRLASIVTFVCLGLLIIHSCKKDDSAKIYGEGYFGFINASPVYRSVNLYASNVETNEMKMNGDSVFSFVNPKFSSYIRINQGNYLFDVRAVNSSASLKTDTLGFAEAEYFSSFFLTKKTVAGNLDSNFIVSFKDQLISSTTPQKAKIRFFNFSPDAPALDLAIKDTTAAPIVANKIFPTRDGSFTEITASSSLILQIRQNGSDLVKYEMPAANYQAGYIYTVYAKGYWNASTGTDSSFTAVLLTNKNNK